MKKVSLLKHFSSLKLKVFANMNPLILDRKKNILSSNFSMLSTKSSNKGGNGRSEPSMKPPNVLVYSPGSCELIKSIVEMIENCLTPNCYTCYSVSTSTLLKDPWMENTKALIVLNTRFARQDDFNQIKSLLQDYLMCGGKLLNFSMGLQDQSMIRQLTHLKNFSGNLNLKLEKSNFNDKSDIVAVESLSGFVIKNATSEKKLICINDDESSCVSCYCDDKNNQIFTTLPLLDPNCDKKISEQKQNTLTYLLHCLGLESTWSSLEDISESVASAITDQPLFMFCTSSSIQSEFFEKVLNSVSFDFPLSASGLKFVSTSYIQSASVGFNEEETKVVCCVKDEEYSQFKLKFKWEVYRNNLFSKRYGRFVLYSDLIPTNMTIYDRVSSNLPFDFGPICIPRQQSKGIGRGGNKWLSPIGCAMFALVVHIPLNSNLGGALSFLQHLTAVASVHGIRTLPGLENVNLTVKWPNDIYYGSSVKLGGVLIKSTIFNGVCIATIGCGVNISNSKPTVCVNDILKEEYRIEEGLHCDKVIARTVSYLEQFIETFQQHGSEPFIKLYYKYWIHSNTEVTIVSDNVRTQCTIIGVDESGFLRARRHSDYGIVTLHPDGNSFDILKNLIVAKKMR